MFEEGHVDYKKLFDPFSPRDVMWRVSRSGIHQRGAKTGEPWCLVVPYLRRVACEERLDEVFGTMGWTTEFRQRNWSDGKGEKCGFICKLSVFDPERGEWISKEDGAANTNIEGFKGGISDAFKRVCSSGFGIGRYLRYMPKVIWASAQWSKNDMYERALVKDNETNSNKTYYWFVDDDVFEPWALPGGSGKPEGVNNGF